MPRERITRSVEVERVDDDGTIERYELSHTVERDASLPRPPRVPDVAREYAAAIAKCAPGFRAKRVSSGSTLRLVRQSEAA